MWCCCCSDAIDCPETGLLVSILEFVRSGVSLEDVDEGLGDGDRLVYSGATELL